MLAGKIMEATAAGRYATAQTAAGRRAARRDRRRGGRDHGRHPAERAARMREVARDDRGRAPEPDAVGVRRSTASAWRWRSRWRCWRCRRCRVRRRCVRRRQEELEGFAGRVAHDLLNPISAAEMSLAAAERGAAGNERMAALIGARAAQPEAGAQPDRRSVRVRAGGRAPGTGRAAPRSPRRSKASSRSCARPRSERGITIDVELPPAPLAVRCASGVLASLLSNLLRNAIKHMGSSPRRQVDVRVSAAPRPRPLRGRGHAGRACRRSWCRRRSTPTCAAPAPASRASAWAWRPCAGWSKGTTAATACRRGRARARCSGSSCRPRGGAARVLRPRRRSRATDWRRARYWRRKNGYVNFCWSSLNAGKRASFATCSTHWPVGVPRTRGRRRPIARCRCWRRRRSAPASRAT